MQAAVAALSDGQAKLDIRLCQLVNLLDEGQPLKMSKRAGRIVTLRDVVDEVGRDVVRFIMLTRKNDAPLDFDLAKVTEQSKDNPVFYVQYAHARICSVFRRAEEDGHDEADPPPRGGRGRAPVGPGRTRPAAPARRPGRGRSRERPWPSSHTGSPFISTSSRTLFTCFGQRVMRIRPSGSCKSRTWT